jgi:hypothetical protein
MIVNMVLRLVSMMMMFVSIIMFVGSTFILLRPVLFSRKIFLAVDPHVHLGGRDAAANDSRNLQTRAYAQSRHSVSQH